MDEWIWPEFADPDLVARFLLEEEAFHDLWVRIAAQMPPREFTRATFELATAYPWARPSGSFALSEGEGKLLSELDPARREEMIGRFTGPGSGRTPMLAIGSNASPEGLWRKFAHFDDPADRTLLAVSGRLHDFDVGASAELALYGSLPATLFPSPGTVVDTWAVWLTDNQLTQLAWAEIPYWLGRLDSRFEAEELMTEFGLVGFESSLVFVNRFGSFAPHGRPFALAAIPASRRRARAMDQIGLLRLTAELAFGSGSSPEDLVRRAFEDPAETGARVAGIMRSNSIPFESDRWTPFPG